MTTQPSRRLLLSGALTTAAVSIGGLSISSLARPRPAYAAPPAPDFGPVIDPYQPFVGQNSCQPTAKPGAIDFRDLLRATYGRTDLGISRDCAVGGASEHKEGRALDYPFNAFDAAQRAQGDDLANWLLATDRHGNPHALARRLGIMYMIWNRRIWKSYSNPGAWAAYTGASPHTDHIHFSLGWPGARRETTWWSGGGGTGAQPGEAWPVSGNPLVLRNGHGRLELFAVGPGGGNIAHIFQNTPDGQWSAWAPNFAGPVGGVPTGGVNTDGRLDLFSIDPGGRLYSRYQIQPAGWGDWQDFSQGHLFAAPPTVARNADGRLELFGLLRDKSAILHRWQVAPSSGWSNWAVFGGPAGARPTVVPTRDGRLEAFVVGPNGANVAHRHQLAPSGAWSGWNGGFGGAAAPVPLAAIRNGTGFIELFAVGPNGANIAHRAQTGAGWNGWNGSFGGATAQVTPSVARNTDGRLELWALAPGNAGMAHRWQVTAGGAWDPWQPTFGGAAACVPSPAYNSSGRIEVFGMPPNGSRLDHRWQTAPSGGWANWAQFGGAAANWCV